jgi:hypothetical protein
MQWQDVVFTIGQIIFLVAFIPTIRGKNKPELSTSTITSIILVVFVLTYLTLNLWGSAIASTGMAIAWATVAYQKYQQDKKK